MRVLDILSDTSARVGELFGAMCPNLPLPQPIQGDDGRRAKARVDVRYVTPAEVESMRSLHAETRHLLCIIMAVVRGPGQREESRMRKYRAAVLLKDFLNSATRLRSIPEVAAVVLEGEALMLQHGRVEVRESVFTRAPTWPAFSTWWSRVLRGQEVLPFQLFENPVLQQ